MRSQHAKKNARPSGQSEAETSKKPKPLTMGHTPGPWVAILDNPLSSIPGHSIKAKDECSSPVAIVHAHTGANGPKEGHDNAHLIAAAPELLDFAMLVLRGLNSGSIKSKPIIDTSDETATEWPMRSLADEAGAVILRALGKEGK